MMGRITRDVMFMEMARVASKRSTCSRLNVGAIIAKDHSPISVGWNGAPAGEPHCAGNDCPGMVPGKCPSLHAETNAIWKAEEVVAPGTKVDLYVTHSPCELCSLALQQSDLYIQRVVFEIPYRSTRHLEMFSLPYNDPRINFYQRVTGVYEVTPAGYTVEYFSRKVVELI